MRWSHLKEQDKSSDIEPQSSFGDRKLSNTLPQLRGRGYKTNGNILLFWQSMQWYIRRPVSENYSSSRMITILIKVQTLFIFSKIAADKFNLLYLKGPNNICQQLITFQNKVQQFYKSISKRINWKPAVRQKGRDLTQSYDKRPNPQRKIQKASWQHKNATKTFDYTTIADRLRAVSRSNSSHPTGVGKPVYGRPTFPVTATSV